MRVKIIRQPHGHITGISLKHYRPGQTYDLPPTLADYLVAEEYAIFEMRDQESPQAPVPVERRKASS
jgi:hypothetical protein